MTLIDSFTVSSDGLSPKTRSYQDIHVNQALIGAHADRDEPAFIDAIVEMENLTSWLAHPDQVDRDGLDGSQRASTARLPDAQATVDDWTVTAKALNQPFRVKETRSRTLVEGEVASYLVLTPPAARPAGEFQSLAHELSNLVTLASGEPSGVISLTLIHKTPDQSRDRDGTSLNASTRVEVVGARIHKVQPEGPSPMDWRFLFTCRDRPFEELVPAWLRVNRHAPEACNVYFGLQYARPSYTETRLLLAAIAAEALHKGLIDEADFSDEDLERLRDELPQSAETGSAVRQAKLRGARSFRERMLELARRPDPDAVEGVLADENAWAKRLTRARNSLAHTGNEDTDDDIFHLEWVSRSLIALVFMRELGLSADVQRRAARDILAPPW